MRIRAEFREKSYHTALKIRHQHYDEKDNIVNSDKGDIERVELNITSSTIIKDSKDKNRNTWGMMKYEY